MFRGLSICCYIAALLSAVFFFVFLNNGFVAASPFLIATIISCFTGIIFNSLNQMQETIAKHETRLLNSQGDYPKLKEEINKLKKELAATKTIIKSLEEEKNK